MAIVAWKKFMVVFGIGLFHISPVDCIKFDRELVGVDLMPYVKKMGNNLLFVRYTFENLKPVVEIVSTKFSKLITGGFDTMSVEYVRNQTYYTGTAIRGRIGEAAALLNRERNNKSLTVYTGLCQQSWTQIQVAAEAAQIANTIYPGTVEGILLFSFSINDINWANSTLASIKLLRNLTSNMGLKIGFLQSCGYFSQPGLLHTSKEFLMLLEEIVLESDFIACLAIPVLSNQVRNANHSFSLFRSALLKEREKIKKINPSINVMLYTLWPAPKYTQWQEYLKDYLEIVNQFAVEENFPVWLGHAFDIPMNKQGHRQTRWWKLKRNDLINDISGYVEKFPDSQTTHQPTSYTSTSGTLRNGLRLEAVVMSAMYWLLVYLPQEFDFLDYNK